MNFLRRIRARLFSGDAAQVLRGTTVLAAGTTVARLIGFASMPVLTRLYAPADFGVLSVFTAVIGMLAPILCLRYVVTIPLTRSDRLAVNLLAGSFLLIVLNTSLLFVANYYGGGALYDWLSVPVLSEWGWLVVTGAALVAVYELGTFWATRQRHYQIIARTKITQSIAGELVKLVLGFAGVKPLGLLAGNVVEQAGGITSFLRSFARDFTRLHSAVSIRRISMLGRYYSSFPVYRLPSQFLLAFSMQAPLMLAASLYGAATAGQFGLALMALAIPGNLIGQAVGQAFYGEVARLGRSPGPRLAQISTALQKRLFLAGIPISIFILLAGEWLFTLVFGDEWSAAGRYASILAPFILLQLTSGPLVQILNLLRSQAPFLAINLARALGLACIYVVCRASGVSPDQFAVILSAFLFVFYAAISVYVSRVVRNISMAGQR